VDKYKARVLHGMPENMFIIVRQLQEKKTGGFCEAKLHCPHALADGNLLI